MKIRISNERILSGIYLGYQPRPFRWKLGDNISEFKFGDCSIMFSNEIWSKIFIKILLDEGIFSLKILGCFQILKFEANEKEVYFEFENLKKEIKV